MTGEAFWVPAVISAVSAAGTAYNQHDQARRQDNALAQGIQQESELNQQAAQKVNSRINTIAADSPEVEEKKASDAYIAQLKRNQGQSQEANPALAGASARYNADTATANSGAEAYGTNLAKVLAAVDAPARSNQAAARGISDTGGEIEQLNSAAKGDEYIASLRAKQQQQNPYITMGATALNNFGDYYAGQYGATPKKKAASAYGNSAGSSGFDTSGLA